MNQMVVGSKVQQMFGSIAARYDRANTILSLGIHYWWRRTFYKMLPPPGNLNVLDLCTGTGDLLPELSRRYQKVLGVDFCLPMLESGAERRKNLFNVSVLQADALQLPLESDTFDLVTVAFGVRNFERLGDGLKEILRILKPGGQVFILEFGQPKGFFWSRIFRFYSDVVMPMIGGLVTGNRAAYTYLPQTSRTFPCGELFTTLLTEAGFERVSWKSLTSGVAYIYEASK